MDGFLDREFLEGILAERQMTRAEKDKKIFSWLTKARILTKSNDCPGRIFSNDPRFTSTFGWSSSKNCPIDFMGSYIVVCRRDKDDSIGIYALYSNQVPPVGEEVGNIKNRKNNGGWRGFIRVL